MNIFTKIGNAIEKRKEKNKKFADKYWKLKPIERMEYDLKMGDINRKSNLFDISITKFFLTYSIIIYFSLLLVVIGSGNSLSYLYSLSRPLFIRIGKALFIFLNIELIFNIINIVISSKIKEIKELNKRFKLE